MPLARRRSKFGMKLHAQEPGMMGQFHNFRQLFIRRTSTNYEPSLFETWHINIIHLITMTMALVDSIPINIMGQSALFHRAALCAFAHRAAQIGIITTLLDLSFAVMPFSNQCDHWMGS